MVPIGCPETSVRNYHYSLRKSKKIAVLNYFAAEAWKYSFKIYLLFLVSWMTLVVAQLTERRMISLWKQWILKDAERGGRGLIW